MIKVAVLGFDIAEGENIPHDLKTLMEGDDIAGACGCWHSIAVWTTSSIVTVFGLAKELVTKKTSPFSFSLPLHLLSQPTSSTSDKISISQLACLEFHPRHLVVRMTNGTLALITIPAEGGHVNEIMRLCSDSIDMSVSKFHICSVTQSNEILIWDMKDPQFLSAPELTKSIISLTDYGMDPHLRVVSTASGDSGHFLALVSSGQVYSWGCGLRGQLGGGQMEAYRKDPRVIEALDGLRVTSIHCGSHFSMAVVDESIVYTFGCSKYGQVIECKDDEEDSEGELSGVVNTSLPVVTMDNLEKIQASCGDNHCLVLDFLACILQSHSAHAESSETDIDEFEDEFYMDPEVPDAIAEEEPISAPIEPPIPIPVVQEMEEAPEEVVTVVEEESGISSDEKIDILEGMVVVSPGKALKFDTAVYETLTTGPRNFSLFVTLTALGLKYNCNKCREFASTLDLVTSTWQQEGQPSDMKAYFANLDYADGKDVFQKLRVNSVPHVLHFPPTEGPYQKYLALKYERYDVERTGAGVGEFNPWLAKAAGIKNVDDYIDIFDGVV
ncbi:tumor suppressor candidate 3 [Blyttiomyces sp. JEL0837]|nr:tumor suppressor candidate 3 [Blyttiomyces sp. JEL0837]